MNTKTLFILFCILFQLQNIHSLYSQETVHIKIDITIPDGIDINQVDATFPPLKYNKNFIFSYTFDDCPVSAYNLAFTTINKKWVDDKELFHYGSEKTTGYFPEKTLGYTDGCGNERRFGLGLALWPNLGNTWVNQFMESISYLKWEDLPPMLDFGSSLYFHNVDQRKWGTTDADQLLYGFDEDEAKVIMQTGRGMKVLMRPDGNDVYVDAGLAYEDIVMIGVEKYGEIYNYYPKDPDFNPYKAVQTRHYFTKELSEKESTYQMVQDAHNSTNGRWIHFFSHGAAKHVLDHFLRLNDDYGKDGDDSMWFATLDEVYEYWYFRKNHTMTKSISGRTITFDIEIPVEKYFYFTDFSLLLSGISESYGLTINTSDNVYGLSYGPDGDALLVNINFNSALKDNVEKYLSKYELSGEQEDKDDVLYFLRQLKPELQDPYRSRLGLPSIYDLESYSANVLDNKYNGSFLYGSNTGYLNSAWKDENVADILIGNPDSDAAGVGVKSLRPALYEDFIYTYGTEIRVDAFKHYEKLGARNNVVFIGDRPSAEHREKKQYIEGVDSESYETLYEPIWDNGENGTPVNDNNDFALYVYDLVKTYGPYVKFWEIKNEPDYIEDYTYADSWWTEDPSPAVLRNLHAPVYSYIRMLRVAYEVIKSVDPDAFVCVGGIGYDSFLDAVLRNTDNPDGGDVTEEYPLKGGAWFDCLSYHIYPMYNLSTWVGSSVPGNINGFKYFRHTDAAAQVVVDYKNKFNDLLKKYGYNGEKYPEKEFIITETNLSSKQVKEYIGSESVQRDYQVKMAVLAQKNSIRGAYIFGPWDNKEFEVNGAEYDYKGFYKPLPATPVYEDLRMHESGISWQTMTRFLYTRKYDAIKTQKLNLPDAVDGGAFYSSVTKDYVYVLWAKTSLDMDETASATYTFPVSESTELRAVLWNGTTVNTTEGMVSLTGTPVFITETILVTDITISQSSISIPQGKTYQLSAEVAPGDATNKEVTWSSDNPLVATVDNTGKVTGISPGTTIVKVVAKDGNKMASCTVEVTAAHIAISFINLNPGNKTINVGDSQQIGVTFSPTNATNKNVTWSSNNESVATVNENGLVTATGVGTAWIYATPEDNPLKEKYATIKVDAGIPVTSVSLDPVSKMLNPGETIQLTASILPTNAKNKAVTWISSDESIVTVDENGLVTAISKGYAVVTVTTANSSKTAICDIMVRNTFLLQIWNPEGGSSDWNNETNWHPAGIPVDYTDVYIPGDVSVFPTLKKEEDNICRDIYFMPGAQLGQPQFLNYRYASVQLDLDMKSGVREQITMDDFIGKGRDGISAEDRLKFGAARSGGALTRSRWYMLSASLKGQFSGDYAFGGYPFTYMRKFDRDAEVNNAFTAGRWSDHYASLIEELQPSEGFAYWVNDHKPQMRYLEKGSEWTSGMSQMKPMGKDNTDIFGLGEMNGILHLPYYNDVYLSTRHRNHDYDSYTDESTFYYFWQSPQTSPYYMQFADGDTDRRKREGANRFIAESISDGEISLDVVYTVKPYKNTQGEFVLLGNPYMSAIDFSKFQGDNISLIKEGYQLWTGDRFEVQANNSVIPPMQSFLIELKETAPVETALKFKYDVANISTTGTSLSLRSFFPDHETNRLCIVAENEYGSVATHIIRRPDARDNFCDLDISKIIEFPLRNKIPEIYTLTPISDSNKNKGLVVNSILTDNQLIPLGIATTYSGQIKLILTGMDNYDGRILFVDSQSGTIDITKRNSFEYPFVHTAILDENGNACSEEQRFFICISPFETDINHVKLNQILAYNINSDLYIHSPVNEIKQVLVYSMQGQLLYHKNGINSTDYEIRGFFNSRGIYLVKVCTVDCIKEFKLIR